jgi:hypothetical protein
MQHRVVIVGSVILLVLALATFRPAEIAPPGKVSRDGVVWWSVEVVHFYSVEEPASARG